MDTNTKTMHVDAARLASCIQSLSVAADLVQSGSGLNDRSQVDIVVCDILTVIGYLAVNLEEIV